VNAQRPPGEYEAGEEKADGENEVDHRSQAAVAAMNGPRCRAMNASTSETATIVRPPIRTQGKSPARKIRQRVLTLTPSVSAAAGILAKRRAIGVSGINGERLDLGASIPDRFASIAKTPKARSTEADAQKIKGGSESYVGRLGVS
jgi:hypothetical protein